VITDINEQKRDQIAEFLLNNVDFAQTFSDPFYSVTCTRFHVLPSVAEFGEWLLNNAEYDSLHLGDWLGTTDGQIIADAVGMVIPPMYKPEYNLAIDGLKLAARIQHEQGRSRFVRGVAKTVGVGCGIGLAAVGIAWIGREAA